MRTSLTRRLSAMFGFAFVALLAGCGGGGTGGSGGPLPQSPLVPSGQVTLPQNGSPLSSSPRPLTPLTTAQGSAAYNTLITSDGAVQFYRLDDSSGSTALDSSGRGANASYLGTPGTDFNLDVAPGPISQETQGWFQSMNTGASHGVKAPGVAAAGNTSSWSLEAWVKLAAAPKQYATIVGGAYNHRLMVASSGKLLYQSPAGSLTTAGSLSPGILYHIVLKSDLSVGANGTVSITINGIKDAHTLAYPSAANRQGMTSAYYLGQYDASANYKWNGYLGRVAYYTSALSDAQISAHFAQGVSLPPTPPPAPTPTPLQSISTTHVMVGSYIYGYGGTPTTVPLASMLPYVTWAQSDEQHAAALRAAGLKIDIYMSFWRNHTTDNPLIGYNDLAPGGAHAAAEVTDCTGKAIYDPTYGGGYEADPRNSAALGHAQVVSSYREQEYAHNWDAIFSDQSGAVGGMGTPCSYQQSAYDAATNAVHAALGVPIWINALGAFSNPASAVDLVNPANVLGAMCEECLSRNGAGGDTLQTGTMWQNVENAEIATVAKQKVYWLYARAVGDPTAELGIRNYVYASFLLGYDPSYSMFEEAFSTPSAFPVMPESGLVPIQPLSTATTVSGYVAPGGAYVRQFAACYYRGQYVGACAAAVNPGTGTIPIMTAGYSHSMVLSGSGVLDGGTAAFNGPQITQLGPASGAVLFP